MTPPAQTSEVCIRDVTETETPEWIADRRELWYKGKLIKKFREPAKLRIAILEAFQELRGEDGQPRPGGKRWQRRVPVPKDKIRDPKTLRNAVDALNRDQSCLEFWRVGKLDFICWRPRPQQESA